MSYTIMSFCGGGIRGLMSATILGQLGCWDQITNGTKLFAGTSTGSGIISWILAGNDPSTICQKFLTQEKKFFCAPRIGSQHPAYDIEEVVLAQRALHGAGATLNSFKQGVLFTSFNVGSNDPARGRQPVNWGPLLFNNLPKSTNGDTLIADAVASSSAMPGMLGSHLGNVDGAFVNHDPTLAAIALAVNEGAKLEEIAVICIGTGFMGNYIASDTAKWGALEWQYGDQNPNSNTPALLVGGTVSPILNISLNGTSSNLVQDLVTMMLPGRCAYLNPVLDRYIPENTTDQADLDYLQRQGKAITSNPNYAVAVDLLKKAWAHM